MLVRLRLRVGRPGTRRLPGSPRLLEFDVWILPRTPPARPSAWIAADAALDPERIGRDQPAWLVAAWALPSHAWAAARRRGWR